jgi:hypothetical protein
MRLTSSALFAFSLAVLSTPPARTAAPKLTGWFACEKCTSPRVGKGDLRPSNPECARQCIEKGSEAVFIDEQGQRLWKVRNYAAVKDDLGFHVEVTGATDAAAGTIAVEAVNRLGDAGASCARPKPAAKK